MRTAALAIALLVSGCSVLFEDLNDPQGVEEHKLTSAAHPPPTREEAGHQQGQHFTDANEPATREAEPEPAAPTPTPQAASSATNNTPQGPFLSPRGFELFPPGHKYQGQPKRWYREDGSVDPDKWDPADLDHPDVVAERERNEAAYMAERERRIAEDARRIAEEREELRRAQREREEAAARARKAWLESANGVELCREWHSSRRLDVADAIIDRKFLTRAQFNEARSGRIEVGSTPLQVLVALGQPDSENRTTTRRGTEVTWHWRRGAGHVVVGFNAEALVDYISDSRY